MRDARFAGTRRGEVGFVQGATVQDGRGLKLAGDSRPASSRSRCARWIGAGGPLRDSECENEKRVGGGCGSRARAARCGAPTGGDRVAGMRLHGALRRCSSGGSGVPLEGELEPIMMAVGRRIRLQCSSQRPQVAGFTPIDPDSRARAGRDCDAFDSIGDCAVGGARRHGRRSLLRRRQGPAGDLGIGCRTT